ncbi:NAD(P)H-binding protein [Nocardia sp. NPDC024068]|uniref:NmrA family NAD(P)-binding protein n=1 Tax=Nocardia sp. NPDC024068 TaxID=3157197 RepID=UPI0033C4285F
MIVVTGGTGTIGGALIRRLRSQGFGREVRAVVRRPVELGVETVLGDFNEPESIVATLSAGDRLFLNAMPFPRFVETFNEVIDLARAAGVAQIVAVSVLGAEPGKTLAMGVHGEVDEHLRTSGVLYAILQPTGFMQNFVADLKLDRFYGSYGKAAVNYIDARDIGDVAAALLTAPVGESRDYILTGPQSPTHDEIAAAMTTALGREIRYVDLPVSELAARLAAEGVPEPLATDLPAMQAAMGRSWAEVHPMVQEVTGRAPRTLDQFLADHISAFDA